MAEAGTHATALKTFSKDTFLKNAWATNCRFDCSGNHFWSRGMNAGRRPSARWLNLWKLLKICKTCAKHVADVIQDMELRQPHCRRVWS